MTLNWKAEFLRFAGMQNMFTVAELREDAEDLGLAHKGIKKTQLRFNIYRELARRMEEQEKGLSPLEGH